ncbi:unnamed protein product [Prorocentrum cordatum]|uniref:Uncharacterized protein n=1 Tax=Prorocentrum cordatum TaxID=2364126 RepID=A0ABN9TKG7_9DINO|nr:unnamed protein product [Polarella glacialis]
MQNSSLGYAERVRRERARCASAPFTIPSSSTWQEPPPVPLLVVGTAFKGYGIFAEVLKNVLEGLDTFVGRYLAVASVFYVGFKWAHFRIVVQRSDPILTADCLASRVVQFVHGGFATRR